MVRQKQRASDAFHDKMKRLFRAADTSKDGLLDKAELEVVLNDEGVRHWLSAMDFKVFDSLKEVDALFDSLDKDGDGQITVVELMAGVNHLKGAARSRDLWSMDQRMEELRGQIESQTSLLQRLLATSKGSSPTVPTEPCRSSYSAASRDTEVPTNDQEALGLLAAKELHSFQRVAEQSARSVSPSIADSDQQMRELITRHVDAYQDAVFCKKNRLGIPRVPGGSA
jgi:Ca2+-binding EF-hand superfamily protein